MCSIALRHPGAQLSHPRAGIFIGHNKTPPSPGVFEPMICVVLQGAKQVLIGDRMLRYDRASYFVATLDLPAHGCIVEATPDQPYIGASMALNRDVLAQLLCEVPERTPAEATGFMVSAMTEELLAIWLRLLSLFDRPEEAAILGPLIERELLYRLLQGPQGAIMRQLAQSDSRLSRIRAAIGWIRQHFAAPLRIEALADIAGMSAASFHRHFKAATAMSPLQYQKALRLQEARRLLISHGDAAATAYRVGYESPSQFSREYARMFGNPPLRDAILLRSAEAAVA
jgi:AraC-like DNA-binding protein